MKKALIILTLLPLLASCGFNYQKSYNEAIRSTYPAYYYEASMEGFSNLHEKKENYIILSQRIRLYNPQISHVFVIYRPDLAASACLKGFF